MADPSQAFSVTPATPTPKPMSWDVLRHTLLDPDFQNLSTPARIEVMKRKDPDFGNLSPAAQTKLVGLRAADLPEQPMEKAWRIGVKSLPYIGATLGGLVAPEGVLPAMGLAALGGGLGSAAEQGVHLAAGDEQAPQSFGEAAKRIGVSAVEQGATELGGRILTRTLGWALRPYFNPERLYHSGLKPPGTSETEAGKTVQTGISERIKLNEWAAGLVKKKIDALDASIERTINNAPADISPSAYVKTVQSGLDALRNKWGADSVQGGEFIDNINDFERQFLIEHGNVQPIKKQIYNPALGRTPQQQLQTIAIEPKDMTLAELRANARPLAAGRAQEIKKATYETIRSLRKSAWQPGAHPGVTLETRRQIARALKQELEQIYPQIGDLNRSQGALINLEDALDRFTKREFNKQVTPYFIFPAAGAIFGGATHGAQGAGAGAGWGILAGHMLRSALEDPAIKSRIAFALDAARKLPGAPIGARVLRESPAITIRGGQYYLQQNPPPAKEEVKRPRAALAPAPHIRKTINQAVTQAAERNQVPPRVMQAIMHLESGGDPYAVSEKGALGPLQMMPATARQYGASDVHDPLQTIAAAGRYVRHLWTKYNGDMRLVLAAYNAGERAVDRAGRRVPNFHETRAYVRRGLDLLHSQAA